MVTSETTTARPTLSEKLLGFALSCTDDLSDELITWASLRFIDTIGVAIASGSYGISTNASRLMLSSPAPGKASMWGSGGTHVRTDDACFGNGMLAHGIEFDDTYSRGTVHPSVVLVPVAVGLSEELGSTGRDTLVAAVIGYEVMARLALLSPGAFQRQGFHPTSIMGIFGGVAIASRLLQVSLDVAVNSAGLAGSMASGLMEYLSDGSDAKQMHPGWAARAAITAVRLAETGATGPGTVLEGKSGIYKAFVGLDVEFEEPLADLGQNWVGVEVSTKPYPACHCVHAPVDSWLALRKRLNWTDQDVAKIRRFTGLVPSWYPQLVGDPLEAKQAPRSVYEARFSLPFSLAMAIQDNRLNLESYSDSRLADKSTLEVASRVDYEILEYPEFPAAFPGGIRVEMEDGQIFEEHLRHNVGSVENPMSAEQIHEKFRDCVGRVADKATTDRLLQSLIDLPNAKDLSDFSSAMAKINCNF